MPKPKHQPPNDIPAPEELKDIPNAPAGPTKLYLRLLFTEVKPEAWTGKDGETLTLRATAQLDTNCGPVTRNPPLNKLCLYFRPEAARFVRAGAVIELTGEVLDAGPSPDKPALEQARLVYKDVAALEEGVKQLEARIDKIGHEMSLISATPDLPANVTAATREKYYILSDQRERARKVLVDSVKMLENKRAEWKALYEKAGRKVSPDA